MQMVEIKEGEIYKESVLSRNRFFDTFAATIQNYDGYSAVTIDQLFHCCNRTKTIQRFIESDYESLHDSAVKATRELNRGSVMNFLQFERRVVTLCSIFTIADSMGVILNRSLFISATFDPRHPFRKFPGVMRLSPEKFIACCKILEKYGALYSIADGHYVSMARGI